VYDNDLAAFIPEIWANEGVAVLIENMVISGMVHRDFSSKIAKFGETVHTRKPAEFEFNRKTKTDEVTVQNAEATDIPVVLNQHLETTFTLQDEDLSKSFQELKALYLVPAILSLVQGLDKITLGQAYQFMDNQQGGLGLGTVDTIKGYMVDTRKRMSINKAPLPGRTLIIGPETEAIMLNLDTFTEADKVGDDGSALREASIGRKYGFDIYQCQNTPSPITTIQSIASKVDNSGGYVAGTTLIHMDTAAVTDLSQTEGKFIKIAGDDTIHRVTLTASPSTEDLDVTITPGLRNAVLDDAVVTIYNRAATTSAYAAGYSKAIVIDGYTGVIEPGTLIAFSTDATPDVAIAGYYSVVKTIETAGDTTSIWLDRPLVNAVVEDDHVDLGPAGEVNFAFERNCLSLVLRPLIQIPSGMGVMSGVASYGDVAIRVNASYEGRKQGLLVTVDLLCGVATLDPYLAALMLC